MDTYNIDEIKCCYNTIAEEYSREYTNELQNKPFDRYILKRFVDIVDQNGIVLDIGAGSGHIGNYAFQLGLKNIIGIDIAEKAISLAKCKYPHIDFRTMDMRNMNFDDEFISGIICFYSIVHFTYTEIETTAKEWNRILKKDGKGLLSFFVGDDKSIRQEKWFKKNQANATWNLFKVDSIMNILSKNHFFEEEVIIRQSYKGVEHPSKRAYILFSKQ